VRKTSESRIIALTTRIATPVGTMVAANAILTTTVVQNQRSMTTWVLRKKA
jgi:hypothetical protein